MQPKNLEDSLKKVKQASNKRNFRQNFELIINLKDIDIKKAGILLTCLLCIWCFKV